MAKRENHYEAAFESFLQLRRVPHVAVDETRRSQSPEGTLKSLDFIVSPPAAERSWLVDVKGRRFPAGRQRQFWKNWSTSDDLRCLSRWEQLFGARFAGLLVFAYELVADLTPVPPQLIFPHKERLYAFVAIRLDHYTAWARTLSPRWDTVSLPAARFRELARPVEEFFGLPTPLAAAERQRA